MKTIFDYSVVHNLYKRYVIEFLPINKNINILDAGCGIGFITNKISRQYINVYGIDINKKSIEFAKKNMLGKYYIGNIESMPFKNNFFDVIIIVNVLEHIKNPNNVIKEFKRILNKNGRIIVLSPCLNGLLMGTLFSRLGHYEKKGGEYHYRDGYYLYELEKLFKKSGFKITKIKYFKFLFPELVTQLLKYISFKIKRVNYKSQADIEVIKDDYYFNIYKVMFFLLYILVLIEEKIFPKIFKGQSMIIQIKRDEYGNI